MEFDRKVGCWLGGPVALSKRRVEVELLVVVVGFDRSSRCLGGPARLPGRLQLRLREDVGVENERFKEC